MQLGAGLVLHYRPMSATGIRLHRAVPFTLFGLCLLVSACSSGAALTKIGEGPLGTVSLERLSSKGTTARYSGPVNSFQASHPAEVSAAQTAAFLAGLQLAGAEPNGNKDARGVYPLFSHEETDFLAPLISKALAEAAPDQRVRFAVKDDGLTTDGTLYVYQNLFRFALAHYRTVPGRTDAKLGAYTLLFKPDQAVVRTDAPQSWMIIEPEQPRIAVSTESLRGLPQAAASPVPQPAGAALVNAAVEQIRLEQELQSTKDLVVKQVEELQRLRDELDQLKKQQSEKNAPPAKAKPKTTPKKQPATP